MTDPLKPLQQTVLVADDDPDLVALMTRRLTKAGFHVIPAIDGPQALELCGQYLPHVAVLDVMMPGLTGIDVMEQLRSSEATRDIPVILISAGSRATSVTSGASAADDYIKKPFGPQELRNRVESVLGR